jgi:hypothetical protein
VEQGGAFRKAFGHKNSRGWWARILHGHPDIATHCGSRALFSLLLPMAAWQAGLTRILVAESPANRSFTTSYQFPICCYLIERSSLKQDGIRAPKMLEI